MHVEKSTQDVAIPDSFTRNHRPTFSSDAQRQAARLFTRKKTECKRHGSEFTLTREWFETKLTIGKCEQTGIPFERGNGSYHPWNFTVDRIDSRQGYTPENCQAVCWCYNAAKSMGTDQDVMRMARALVLAIRD